MFGILRTILAINVVLLHIFSVPTLGNYSVSFFFVLSGFLMTFIMHETYGFDLKGVKFFLVNRILRLYPIYLIIIIITVFIFFLFPNTKLTTHPHLFLPETISEWIGNLTMIYPKILPYKFTPRLSPVSWALTNELVFYVLISLGISKTKLRTLLWLLFSVAYFAGTYLYYDIPSYRYGAIPSSSLPFALGACLYWLNKKYPLSVNPVLILGLFILFNLNAIFSKHLPYVLKEITIYINYILAVLITYTLFGVKMPNRIKKIDTYIGNYSYPIYLAHYLIAILYSLFIGYGVLKTGFKLGFDALVPYFMMLILFCIILVHLIDIRVTELKKKIKKKV